MRIHKNIFHKLYAQWRFNIVAEIFLHGENSNGFIVTQKDRLRAGDNINTAIIIYNIISSDKVVIKWWTLCLYHEEQDTQQRSLK